jgi:dienelactone hydrolase
MSTTLMRAAAPAIAVVLAAACAGRGAEGKDDLAGRLRTLDARVLAPDEARRAAEALRQEVRGRLRAAGDRETSAWHALKSRADWERYRDARLKALRDSLGTFPAPPTDLKVRVTRRLEGDGYRIACLVFESRPGLVVTANLYAPARPTKAMPGVLICHSHHNPKTEGELQDMGVGWARAGCLVLVMDQLGHGERRQHPFRDAKSYPRPFRPSRQDYYFRYNSGLQLSAIGDGLMGWMVWDLMRGVDLLLSRPGIDRDRIILLGSVAGGGDPAAVTAALDRRITAAAPFNFGGPQPETTYPLPADPERRFLYTGSGSWESTRNLRLSARDGFLPWVIVAGIAPRRLVYGHEFAWDREHDPVWTRLRQVYAWYGAPDRLASSHGRGSVRGRPPESTHCNNIGPVQRQGIHEALKKWFAVPTPADKPGERRPAADLACLTPAVRDELKPKPLHELAAALGKERAEAARRRRAGLSSDEHRQQLRREWARLLGTVEPPAEVKVAAHRKERLGEITLERIALDVGRGPAVPLLVLTPPHKPGARPPVVVMFAQSGKQAILKNRSGEMARLLAGGAAVVLPDLRGTGETASGTGHGRSSAATALASSEWMIGETPVGQKLADLRAVLRYLRGRRDLAERVALWGDSFAPVNARDRNLAVPLDADLPDQAEPAGGLLALLGALYEDTVAAVYVRGGLTGYEALLTSPFCYVPADVVVPGALTAGDLCDVAAALAPRPLRLEGLVDGLNRRAPVAEAVHALSPARAAYRAAGAAEALRIDEAAPADSPASHWLIERLRTK